MIQIKVVRKDIMKFTEDYLIHQCNCVTNRAKGLSESVFRKFPKSDVYALRKNNQKDTPGTYKIIGKIINLFAQRYPGKGRYNNDSTDLRLKWFKDGFEALKKEFEERNVSIAFPFKIGCGYGGGDWKEYFKFLSEFNHSTKNITLVMYKLPDKKAGGYFKKKKIGFKRRRSEENDVNEKKRKTKKQKKE